MGAYTLAKFPTYLDKWKVRYELNPGWQTLGRSSGGFDNVFGVQVHHSAGPETQVLRNVIYYCTVSAPAKPIGNGTVSRDRDGPKLVLWAGKASNTAGKGGPRLTSRGVIPLDAANRLSVAWEAENNGSGERWSETMCDLYLRVVCATLDWANHETPGAQLDAGDVFAHFEWAPSRKNDPAGPSRWNGYTNRMWNMDLFRRDIANMLADASTPVPTKPPTIGTYTVVAGDGWWAISRKTGFSMSEIQQVNKMTSATVLHPGMVLLLPMSSQHPDPDTLDTPPGTPAMRYGDTDANTIVPGVANDGRVTWLQVVLRVPPTGTYDTAMANSVRVTQQNLGIFVDGVYGDQTFQALRNYRGR